MLEPRRFKVLEPICTLKSLESKNLKIQHFQTCCNLYYIYKDLLYFK